MFKGIQDPVKRKILMTETISDMKGCLEAFQKIIIEGNPSNLVDAKIAQTAASTLIAMELMIEIAIHGMGITVEDWNKHKLIAAVSMTAEAVKEMQRRENEKGKGNQE